MFVIFIADNDSPNEAFHTCRRATKHVARTQALQNNATDHVSIAMPNNRLLSFVVITQPLT